jgi:hypothetical protein
VASFCAGTDECAVAAGQWHTLFNSEDTLIVKRLVYQDNIKPAEAGFLFGQFSSLTAHAANTEHRHQAGHEDHGPFTQGGHGCGCR